jgi:hypothetical protein
MSPASRHKQAERAAARQPFSLVVAQIREAAQDIERRRVMQETKDKGGRPARDLPSGSRRLLRRAKARVEAAEDNLAEAAAMAFESGASLRAIAEELGVARETAKALVEKGQGDSHE